MGEEAGACIPAETRNSTKGTVASVGGGPARVADTTGSVPVSHSLEQCLCSLQEEEETCAEEEGAPKLHTVSTGTNEQGRDFRVGEK